MGIAPKPSGYANTKAGKTAILERTKKLVDTSSVIIAVPWQGVSKEQVDMLKKEIPASAKASVVKNALMRKSIAGTKFEALTPKLKGENMYFFIPEGESKPTYEGFERWAKEIKRTESNQVPTGACMENVLYVGQNIKSVVNLPTKKELITKIAQGIKAVPTKVGRAVGAVPNKLGRAFGAIKDKLEKEAA